MKKTAVKYYYLMLGILVSWQAIHTVLTLSQTIGFGTRINYLEQEKKSLLAESQVLEYQISQELSLQQIATTQELQSDFQMITETISITDNLATIIQ